MEPLSDHELEQLLGAWEAPKAPRSLEEKFSMKTEEVSKAHTTTRRSFYSALIAGLGTVMGAALAIPAAVYLLFKPKSAQKSSFVEAADLTQLKIGKPEVVTFRRSRVDGWRVVDEKSTAWVVKMNDKDVVAYAPQCTHLGCAYHWDEQQTNFVCPCHTSVFSVEGKVLSGPAPRPLDRYTIQVQGTKLLVGSDIQKSAQV
jgi:menaquinol-cytochrome c reductase iron-sulfur subunit